MSTKNCSRCYSVVSKLFDIKELTPLSPKYYTPFAILNICFRCKEEVGKVITRPYEVEEK